VESQTQSVQIAPDTYEQRERTEAHTQAPPATSTPPQASVQSKEPDMVIAQAAQKPVPAAAIHVQSAITAQSVVEPQTVATTAKPYRIEVSNGNGVTGLARKMAGSLESEGYSGARLTNQKPFKVASSQVQYRSGYREQAQLLVLNLPGQPSIVQADNLRRDISLRIVLGKDLAGNVANFEQRHVNIHLVRHGSDS
jgi:hypothetical protein